jgi:hypothetical protein
VKKDGFEEFLGYVSLFFTMFVEISRSSILVILLRTTNF